MIGHIRGILVEKHPPRVVIEAAGVGYELEVPMSTFYQLPPIGEEARLRTHLVVREDAHLLYGFWSGEEREAFLALTRVSGIGARIALAVLSGMGVGELANVVARQEAAPLIRIPGIGRKTAERLLLEMKDKLPQVGQIGGVESMPPASGQNDAMAALIALGCSEKEAAAAMAQVPEGLSVEDSIRQALRYFTKGL